MMMTTKKKKKRGKKDEGVSFLTARLL